MSQALVVTDSKYLIGDFFLCDKSRPVANSIFYQAILQDFDPDSLPIDFWQKMFVR